MYVKLHDQRISVDNNIKGEYTSLFGNEYLCWRKQSLCGYDFLYWTVIVRIWSSQRSTFSSCEIREYRIVTAGAMEEISYNHSKAFISSQEGKAWYFEGNKFPMYKSESKYEKWSS